MDPRRICERLLKVRFVVLLHPLPNFDSVSSLGSTSNANPGDSFPCLTPQTVSINVGVFDEEHMVSCQSQLFDLEMKGR